MSHLSFEKKKLKAFELLLLGALADKKFEHQSIALIKGNFQKTFVNQFCTLSKV